MSETKKPKRTRVASETPIIEALKQVASDGRLSEFISMKRKSRLAQIIKERQEVARKDAQ
jgi:hypothetical protein